MKRVFNVTDICYPHRHYMVKLDDKVGKWEHQYNSPWNIAAKFDIDMSLSVRQIAGMLGEYETDHHTGMEMQTMADDIYAYTSGYPVSVSFLRKCMDEEFSDDDRLEESMSVWTMAGVERSFGNLMLVEK